VGIKVASDVVPGDGLGSTTTIVGSLVVGDWGTSSVGDITSRSEDGGSVGASPTAPTCVLLLSARTNTSATVTPTPISAKRMIEPRT
jgi:hypothetical protein